MARQLTTTTGILLGLGLLVLAPDASSIQRRSSQQPPAPTAAPTRRSARPVPFHIGETLTYDVSWSSYLSAGTAVVSVKEKRPSFDSTAYYIVAEARPTPLLSKLYTLYYKLDTLLDAYTLRPQRGSVYTEEGNRHRFKTTRFDRRQQKAFFEYQSGNTIKSEFTVPAFTQDALSAIYVMRAIPFKRAIHDDAGVRRWLLSSGDRRRSPGRKTPLGELNVEGPARPPTTRARRWAGTWAVWISTTNGGTR